MIRDAPPKSDGGLCFRDVRVYSSGLADTGRQDIMADRKQLLLRLPSDLKDELERWARDDLRSLNAQIEFLLREAVRRQRRAKSPPAHPPPP